MPVPLLDLTAQFRSIKDEVMPAIEAVVESQRFIMGQPVAEFERAIGEWLGVDHVVTCASGTDALLLPLKALQLEPGDEVITTPFTFFATAGAISNAGGTPVFVDIDPGTFNLNIEGVEAAITPRTRAVIPVHLFGQMAPMEELVPLADRHGLSIIEDAAQAIGARRVMADNWRKAGQIGLFATFSFFPSKNLGCWGDGGMMVARDAESARVLRLLRTHGGAKQYHHDMIGTNSRLDTLQAAVLLAKLPHLDDWNRRRRAHAAAYDDALADVPGVTPPTSDEKNECVFHQYTIRATNRDALKQHLQDRGIGCAVYYPVALHRQPCYAPLGYSEGQFPHAEQATREVLSLPVYPELTSSQRNIVISAIKEFAR